jgi:microcystin-dependent protein
MLSRISLLVLALIAAPLIYSQTYPDRQLHFQGKLFQDGVAFNGTGTFQFTISDPAWVQVSSNVDVINGLYSVILGGGNTPLPGDLFLQTESVDMSVSFNGQLIDEVTLYAPFEKDYTVPDYIKDGIDWSEIQNVPALDLSPTNEIQQLSINGTQLTLSNGGGSVVLPQSGETNPGDLTVNGAFNVIDTSCVLMYYQEGFSNIATFPNIWQVFKATSNGQLRKIRATFSVNGATGVIVRVFDGTDITGQPIASASLPISLPSNISDRTLDLTGLFAPEIQLEAGEVYTFQIVPNIPAGATIDARFSIFNPYPSGYCQVSTSSDLVFGVYIDNSSPPIFSAQSGFVGIGVSNPTSALEVNGRIKDQTGYVMPVGAVLPYFGATAPEGWLLCDGDAISRIMYSDLFEAIGTSCGQGDGEETFNLPDLRGRFLRGVDGGAGNDPDRLTRTDLNNLGGNTGDNVGSYQSDALRSHNHTVNALGTGQVASGSNGWAFFGSGSTGGVINNSGGNETRPVNVYCNYIIKY